MHFPILYSYGNSNADCTFGCSYVMYSIFLHNGFHHLDLPSLDHTGSVRRQHVLTHQIRQGSKSYANIAPRAALRQNTLETLIGHHVNYEIEL